MRRSGIEEERKGRCETSAFSCMCYLKRLYKNYEFGRKLQYKDTNDWQ